MSTPWINLGGVAYMLRDFIDSGIATIAAVIINDAQSSKAVESKSRFVRLARKWRSLPYAAYLRYDRPNLSADTDPVVPQSV